MSEFLPPFHWTNLLIIPSLLLAYTVHELAHAFTAYYLGDYSQVERGRLTLNPLEHIAWLGALAFVLIGIGWPKSLHVNPYNFKRKFLDVFLVAVSGPLAGLVVGVGGIFLTVALAGVLITVSGATFEEVFQYLMPMPEQAPQSLNIQAWSIALTWYIAYSNLLLMIISLLPLPGLDGFVAVVSLVGMLRENSRQPDKKPKNQIESTLVDDSPMMLAQQKRRNAAADIHFKLGTEYHQQKKYDDAIARYRQAIGNDQHFGPAYINTGLAYLAKGERKRAIQAFRGAVEYADDKRSQNEAWYQLHRLSEVSPVDENSAKQDMAQIGNAPWIDTRPRPNWLSLGVTGIVLLVGILFTYSYLLAELIEIFGR